MFNSTALNVVIGLVFIYLLYSLLATILQEIIASYFSFRASILEKAISRMLDDDGKSKEMVALFYKHPLMKYLGEDVKRSKPSYINNSTFSKVMLDLLRTDAAKPGDDVKLLIEKTLSGAEISWNTGTKTTTTINPETLQYLRSLWIDSQGDVAKYKQLLENWFDETMDRASGWYKKQTQFVLFFIGLAIAITFNVDTIKIVNKLEKDPQLTEQLVHQADSFLKAHPDLDKELAQQKEENEKTRKNISVTDSAKGKAEEKKLDSLDSITYAKNKALRDTLIKKADSLVNVDIKKTNDILGIGLNTNDCNDYKSCWLACFFKSLLGWTITALALSLGAPFWFDLLNKLMRLRSSVATAPDDDKQSADGKTQKQSSINPKG